jgi:hypothetical protein
VPSIDGTDDDDRSLEMKRSISLSVVIALALSLMAGTAAASPLDDPHPHVLLLGADISWVEPGPGQPPYIIESYRKCVDLAGGQTLEHNRFHHNVHFGQANRALVGAGHIVVPFASCAELGGANGE